MYFFVGFWLLFCILIRPEKAQNLAWSYNEVLLYSYWEIILHFLQYDLSIWIWSLFTFNFIRTFIKLTSPTHNPSASASTTHNHNLLQDWFKYPVDVLPINVSIKGKHTFVKEKRKQKESSRLSEWLSAFTTSPSGDVEVGYNHRATKRKIGVYVLSWIV